MDTERDPEELHERLDSEAEDMQKKTGELDQQIGDVREDWETKQSSQQVPGAEPEDDFPVGARDRDEAPGTDEDEDEADGGDDDEDDGASDDAKSDE